GAGPGGPAAPPPIAGPSPRRRRSRNSAARRSTRSKTSSEGSPSSRRPALRSSGAEIGGRRMGPSPEEVGRSQGARPPGPLIHGVDESARFAQEYGRKKAHWPPRHRPA